MAINRRSAFLTLIGEEVRDYREGAGQAPNTLLEGAVCVCVRARVCINFVTIRESDLPWPEVGA